MKVGTLIPKEIAPTKKSLKKTPRVDVPTSQMRPSLNPLIAEPTGLDINPLVSDRRCRTDRRSGWRKVFVVMVPEHLVRVLFHQLTPSAEMRECA